MAHKLENPKRVEELNPKETLMKIGLSRQSIFCDIGAGTGIFTFAAAKMTENTVYAVEISSEMQEILRSKNNSRDVSIVDSVQSVPTNSCDVALLCTVLHELSDISAMMRETKRILNDDGILAIIEFHKAATPMGPPVARRISEIETSETLKGHGFIQTQRFILSENFYSLVFKQTMEVCAHMKYR
jgi:ubiquinone/menaquinone biosynthesis C-methylase UbiE